MFPILHIVNSISTWEQQLLSCSNIMESNALSSSSCQTFSKAYTRLEHTSTKHTPFLHRKHFTWLRITTSYLYWVSAFMPF